MNQLPTRIGYCIFQRRSRIDFRFASAIAPPTRPSDPTSDFLRISRPPALLPGFNLRLASAAASFRLCQATQTLASVGYKSSGCASESPADFHRLLILRRRQRSTSDFPRSLNPRFHFLRSSPTLIGYQPFSGSGDQLPTFCGSSVGKNIRTGRSVHASANSVNSVDIKSWVVSSRHIMAAEIAKYPSKMPIFSCNNGVIRNRTRNKEMHHKCCTIIYFELKITAKAV